MLRGATKAKVIEGWYWHGEPSGPSMRYVVNASKGHVTTFNAEAAVGYCEMLREAGIEPLYRTRA